ncbi:L,D-transpeptidase family protein [Aquamicrobium lusatiense]|uniref:L,D-transpeptidase family protein n=1 Tax=Aquamicrobium lusatiense TaxID=89772 RepID=UPI0024563AB1|nr:L,D-transpeptidase family protein [Aquamicrobium lusatiense]MDH4990179.1 L,D-transpeptidase family protein [Aquamicrobium lusatiense]
MQLRSFILMSLCASLYAGATAYAAPIAAGAAPQAPAVTDVVEVAAKSAASELKVLKRKKKPTDEDLARIQELEKQVKIEQAQARAKAIEAKKLAMREAAKAKSEAERKAFQEKREQSRAARAERAPAPVRQAPVKPQVVAAPAVIEEVQQPLSADAMAIARTGNNGELRSEARDVPQQRRGGLFGGLFNASASAGAVAYLPETRALDSVLQERQARKKFNVKPEFEPQQVNFTGYEPGTIVIDTNAHRLYLVETPFTARRYAIAVGRDGLQYKGTTVVGDKQEWPRWIPTKDMQQREPAKYGRYKDGMPGGPDNPLGARAIYLYEGKKDTYLRIHGTNQPQTIGTNSSNGCFRMINDHVMDLYRRVKTGTKVVVL